MLSGREAVRFAQQIELRANYKSFYSARYVRKHHFQPAPDLVIMFVPGETLLSAALQRDPSLLDFSLGAG